MVQEFKLHSDNKFTCFSKTAWPVLSQGSVERMLHLAVLLRGRGRGTKCFVSPCSSLISNYVCCPCTPEDLAAGAADTECWLRM